MSFLFRLDDAVLAVVGGVFAMSGFIVRGLAPTPWVLYLSKWSERSFSRKSKRNFSYHSAYMFFLYVHYSTRKGHNI